MENGIEITYASQNFAKDIPLPVVYITPKAKQMLDAYIKICPYEISGLGKVSRIGNDFLIEEVYLFGQEVNSAKTDLSQDAIQSFLYETVKRNLDPSVLKLWWHSHANIAVSWSMQDKETINNFDAAEYMISVVGNKAGQHLVRLDIYRPVRVMLDDLELRLMVSPDDLLNKAIAQEIYEKVTLKQTTCYCYQGYPGFPGEEDGQSNNYYTE